MSDCDYIAHARLFAIRRLEQLLQPQAMHVSIADSACRIPKLKNMQAVAVNGDVKDGSKVAVRLGDGKVINVRGSDLVFEGGATAVEVEGRWVLPLKLKTKEQLVQRPLRALYDASTDNDSGGACTRTTAAACVRVRCGEIAFLSVRLARYPGARHVAGTKPRIWAAAIAERVFGGFCKRVQVGRRSDVLSCIFCWRVRAHVCSIGFT
jgi:hypothetical protein